MSKELVGMRVAILATDGVEAVELSQPRKALDEAGTTTRLITPKSGSIQGMKHDEKSEEFESDMTLDDADPNDFDALLLPGGALNADALRVVEDAQEFARKMDQSGKPIAVICHGPWLLVSAGLAKGRTLTSYHTIQDDIQNAGAKWVDEEVVRDRNWVSSRKPDDIPAFNREMLKLFGELRRNSKAATAA